MKQLRVFFIVALTLFYTACSTKTTSSIKSIAQTNSASAIETYKKEVLRLLIKYKKKLDLRNPSAYNKNISSSIIDQIHNTQNYINIIQNRVKLTSYKQYLYYAFSKDEIQNRNDLLILGIYKLIYKAFDIQSGHKFIAGQYDKEEMIRLYEYLQVIRWKIRKDKNKSGTYLFNTWQNNWQLELAKRDLSDLNIINSLKYIKNKKESIFDHSNFSFEIIISNMLVNIEHILRKIDIEPYELGVSALTSFVFIF